MEHSKKTEVLAFFVYSICIIVFLLFFREWVLSGVIGALTALLNFRIQVKGIRKFGENQNPVFVAGNFYLRLAVVGAVLYFSFQKPMINPFVVFAFIVSFHFFIIISSLLSMKK